MELLIYKTFSYARRILMRNKTIPIFLLSVFLLAGCGTKAPVFQLNHAPAPNHVLRLTSIQTGIVLYSQILRHYEHTEDDETDVWYSYVDTADEILFEKDVVSLGLSVRIANDAKIPYQLVHVYTVAMKEDVTPPETKEELIYTGDFSRKEFFVPAKYTDAVAYGVSWLELRDMNGEIILRSQPMRYKGKEVMAKKEGP